MSLPAEPWIVMALVLAGLIIHTINLVGMLREKPATVADTAPQVPGAESVQLYEVEEKAR